MEDIDGGLHPAVDGQSLDEDEDEVIMIIVIATTMIGTLIKMMMEM